MKSFQFLNAFVITFACLTVLGPQIMAEAPADGMTWSQAQKILKEVSKQRLNLVSEKELHGQSAYVSGDFNADGLPDLAMTAMTSTPGKTFVVIATQSKGTWQLVYSLPLADRPVPFIQVGGMDSSLEVGSVRSDKQPITVFWDVTSKRYMQSGASD